MNWARQTRTSVTQRLPRCVCPGAVIAPEDYAFRPPVAGRRGLAPPAAPDGPCSLRATLPDDEPDSRVPLGDGIDGDVAVEVDRNDRVKAAGGEQVRDAEF